MTGRPASLGRVPVGRVPLLRRYYQGATTPCRSSRRTWLPSFGDTADGRLRFRGHRRQATNTCDAGHIGHPDCPHIPGFRAETTGPPTFLGNPGVLLPCSTTPAGPSPLAYTNQGDDAALVQTTTKAPPLRLSRLNHTASALAAYASSGRSPCTTLGVCPRNGLSQRDRGRGMGQSVSGPCGAWETGIREVAGLVSFRLVTAERAGARIPLPIPQAVATC